MTKEKSGSGVKDLREEISFQLNQSLGKLKETLGEKKFNSRIKKAVKLLTEDLDTLKKDKVQKTPKPDKVKKVKPVSDKPEKVTSPAKSVKPVKVADKPVKPIIKAAKDAKKKVSDKK